MNLVDLGVLLVASLAALRGFRQGMVGQLFEFGGGALGLLVGLYLGPRASGLVTDQAGLASAAVSLVVVFGSLAVGQTLGFVAGHRFRSAAHDGAFAPIDRGFGSALSIVATLLAFWLVGSLLVQGPSRSLAQALRRSTLLTFVTDVMPEPPNVFAYIQHYLNTSGFPQVFAGLPRDIGPPVRLPSGTLARRAARGAQDSTVRIVVAACGGTQLGSGWVAAPETIVTNAHVVAGGTEVTVQDLAGDHPGTVVLFDKDTDVAVIKVAGLSGSPLELVVEEQERGTPGATLGYPGARDGRLVVHRAAVQAHFDAVGRDIYGRKRVERDIYELRSPVRQGDSGGPFVLPGGRVAGVVFAASTTDGRVGYALTGAEVRDELNRGVTRTEPVGTGACTR